MSKVTLVSKGPKEGGTKDKIFEVAVDLFANRGYNYIGVRDIAKVVGIKSSSIYNHYENKDAILEGIFLHFDNNYYDCLLATKDAVDMLPGTPPIEVLEMLSPITIGRNNEMLGKIFLIAISEYSNDIRARECLSRALEATTERFSQVLYHMVEHKVIEPIDVELFSTIFVSFCACSTLSHFGGINLTPCDRWQDGQRLLLELVLKRD